jgi:hypothetical protein
MPLRHQCNHIAATEEQTLAVVTPAGHKPVAVKLVGIACNTVSFIHQDAHVPLHEILLRSASSCQTQRNTRRNTTAQAPQCNAGVKLQHQCNQASTTSWLEVRVTSSHLPMCSSPMSASPTHRRRRESAPSSSCSCPLVSLHPKASLAAAAVSALCAGLHGAQSLLNQSSRDM